MLGIDGHQWQTIFGSMQAPHSAARSVHFPATCPSSFNNAASCSSRRTSISSSLHPLSVAASSLPQCFIQLCLYACSGFSCTCPPQQRIRHDTALLPSAPSCVPCLHPMHSRASTTSVEVPSAAWCPYHVHEFRWRGGCLPAVPPFLMHCCRQSCVCTCCYSALPSTVLAAHLRLPLQPALHFKLQQRCIAQLASWLGIFCIRVRGRCFALFCGSNFSPSSCRYWLCHCLPGLLSCIDSCVCSSDGPSQLSRRFCVSFGLAVPVWCNRVAPSFPLGLPLHIYLAMLSTYQGLGVFKNPSGLKPIRARLARPRALHLQLHWRAAHIPIQQLR